jgi:transketolase
MGDLTVTSQPGSTFEWTGTDRRAVDLIRVLAMDATQQAGSGHPGTAGVSVEAGIAQGWREFTGDAGECVSLEHFGASADYQTLYSEFGFTEERVAAARSSIARTDGPEG